MTLTIPDDVRAKAEIYVGDAAGQEKTRFLLQETGLPSGLLPLRDIIECGYVEETGFVWLKQRRKVDHYFAKAGRHVSYGTEVSAIAEPGRLRKITGVKAKEMLIWVSLHEICLDEPPSGKLVCKAIGGLSRSFPVEAFEADASGGALPEPVKPADGDENADDAAAEEEEVKEQEDVKKPEGEEAEKEGEKNKEEDGKKAKEDVEKVEEKLKELSTTEAVQTEAVAAKN
ncbi:hypothetical protein PR202_gb23961 [Eleusine coracana subsp. coracana]|uniref:Uncharacterized protein n=1 Tax=Eleusine coracana subsp. coracana TaxID=191504 RepID=A0AAV5FKA8_ELECO|nr:hypothetical protein PR202_gb23961 [Eleusine coracana subsp. coracana]